MFLFFLSILSQNVLAKDWPEISKPLSPSHDGRGDSAIIISIADYDKIPDISNAEENARDWYVWLINTKGLSPSRVSLIENEFATKENIIATTKKTSQNALVGGKVWYIFIGYGVVSSNGTDRILIGSDTRPTIQSLYSRGISQREIVSILESGKQKETIAVIDAVFDGADSNGDQIVPGTQPLIPSVPFKTSKVAMINSKTRIELEGLERPALSYLILGGLRGWADQNKDSKVSIREAASYASKVILKGSSENIRKTQMEQDWAKVSTFAARQDEFAKEALRAFIETYPDSNQSEGARRILEAQSAPKTPTSKYRMQRVEIKAKYRVKNLKVSSGEFTMGSPITQEGRKPDEKMHDVVLSYSFYIGEAEVTQGMWKEIMGFNPAITNGKFWDGKKQGDCIQHSGVSLINDNYPAICVSWVDAAKFANAMSKKEGLEECYVIKRTSVHWVKGIGCKGYRLPTEAEWEYVAKAGTNSVWSGTSLKSNLCQYANISDVSSMHKTGRKTDVACSDKAPVLAEVRSYRPNTWMVHDMTGNVWEWVWDVYGEYPEEEITDPTGGVGGNTHVFRGGSWVFESNDARVTNRVRFDKNGRFTDLGVRLVRTAE